MIPNFISGLVDVCLFAVVARFLTMGPTIEN
jgi:hypothetical protein